MHKDGSPVIAARLAQRIIDGGNSNRLICHFTESHQALYKELQEAVSGFAAEVVRVYPGTFQQHMPAVLAAIGTAPAVFFLDPFGVDDIPPEELQKISCRRDTELLLNLNTNCLRRMAGFEDSMARDAKAKLALVSRVLGENPSTTNPLWLRKWYEFNNGILWEEWAANKYAQCLIDINPYLQYAVTYPVRPYYGANPKYYLVFATRSKEPFPILNDLICTEDENLFGRAKPTKGALQQISLGLFDSLYESQQSERVTALVEAVHSYGLSNQECSRNDVFMHFSMERFGEFKKKHYRSAIDQLVAMGRATFKSGKNDAAPITFSP